MLSVAAVGGLVGAIFFLLGSAVIIYILWKKRCARTQYEELSSEGIPTLVYKNCGNQIAVSVNPTRQIHSQRARSIPFVVPPKFDSREWVGIENGLQIQDDNENYTAPDLRCCSFQSSGVYAFGKINPDLYSEEADEMDYPDNNIGRLWFVVEYESETERLLVSLIKARNLQLSSCETCNPFVKIYLLPDERRHLQSKVKQKTKNPQFDERFVFQVSGKTLHQRTLKFLVCSLDQQKKHHTVGSVIFPLTNEMQHEVSKLVVWKDLEVENPEHPSAFGDLQFSMSYNDYLGRLTLVVLRARGLHLLEEEEEEKVSNLYVKVSLMKRNKLIKCKKTAIIQRTPHPVFNETLSFRLDSEELSTASVSLSVHQRMEKEKSHPLGRVVVGPFMYARGRELEHWNDMINRPKELVKQWHALTCSM
ncbi:synaptotagmin-15-like isoform X2 [Protopterus annectens]|uniref:synaptotagmin-15-like isoform X1 n=1 Tax=Protopterus annectens TaxID=7888 RepID=UPI001CF9901A|nr:synaptotagmin-15-like isoform X1 [Protopterus annectens]XP_043912441.1 synaptotagmin-15-like isoform X1 [Protopterus annectens]XP_043912442.1 synaptotagmin-15-like isoform X2 [Protopterus annectens]